METYAAAYNKLLWNILDLYEVMLECSGGGSNQFANVCFVSRVFQRVNDLPPTGELDEATMDVIRQPRCGIEDPFNKKHHKYRMLGESTERLDFVFCRYLICYLL